MFMKMIIIANSKNIKLPLQIIYKDIFTCFIIKNLNSMSFAEIYSYLQEKYNINNFNSFKLYKLLKTKSTIEFNYIKNLYINYLELDTNFDYKINNFKSFIIKNKDKFQSILKIFDLDFIKSILNNNLFKMINYINKINLYFNNYNNILDFDVYKINLIDKNYFNIFIDIFYDKKIEEMINILSNDINISNYIDNYFINKNINKDKIEFIKIINYVNPDNLNIRLQYLFNDDNLNKIFQKYKIEYVKDFKNLSYDALNKLKYSIIDYLNKKYINLIKLLNKDNNPNQFWKKYFLIIKYKAEGHTLNECSRLYNLTRERIRQIINNYINKFNELYNKDTYFKLFIQAIIKEQNCISNEDIIILFHFNPTVFKFLLMNLKSNNLIYIKKSDKFYFK